MPREFSGFIESAAVPSQALPADGWPAGAGAQVLSRDAETGALTALVTLAPGFRRESGVIGAASSIFVLSGSLEIGASACGFGHFEHSPAGAAQPAWRSGDGCRLLLFVAGSADFAPARWSGEGGGRVAIDSERLPWRRGRIPGPPPGLYSKTLWHDDETGARVFLSACVRRYDYPLSEYHDCAEESFRIAGDMRLATTGLMTAGSYYWRPPYVTHGPFYSRSGSLALVTVDGPLINHYVEDPWRSAEDNRRDAMAREAPRDHLAGWKPGD